MSWWGAILIWVLAFGAIRVVNVVFEWSLRGFGWFALYLGIGASLTVVAVLWWPGVLLALVAMGVAKWLADWRGWDLTPGWWFLLYLGLTLGRSSSSSGSSWWWAPLPWPALRKRDRRRRS